SSRLCARATGKWSAGGTDDRLRGNHGSIEATMMGRFVMRALLILLSSAILAYAQATQPLHLEKTIELPDVQGRIDHMSIDIKGERLFVSALGNNTVEVIDLKAGKRVNTIPGLQEPQGALYVPGANRLYVANGKDGSVRIFDGTSLKL